MHIAIDARILGTTTGTLADRLLHHLQAIAGDHRFDVLLNREHADSWTPHAANFTKHLVDVPFNSLAEQTQLRRVLAALQPDLIHFCSPQQPLLFYRGRKVTTFHDLTQLRLRNPLRSAFVSGAKRAVGWPIARAVVRENARIITPSAFTRDDVVRHLRADPAKVAVIYEAAEIHPGELAPYEHPFARYLLYVGRHSAYKNVNRLCDAHQRLLADHPDFGLILVGRKGVETEATERHCREHGYRNIVFTGYLPDAQRDWLYGNAAAYVFPSFAEGFGLPGLEAMGYGAPVISSDATCLPEIYGDGALYFAPGDVDAMAGAIRQVIEDPQTREHLIERGRARVEVFSWARMAEETLRLYEQVAGTPTQGRNPTAE